MMWIDFKEWVEEWPTREKGARRIFGPQFGEGHIYNMHTVTIFVFLNDEIFEFGKVETSPPLLFSRLFI